MIGSIYYFINNMFQLKLRKLFEYNINTRLGIKHMTYIIFYNPRETILKCKELSSEVHKD